ncbi:S8 family serine peptidase [Rhizobium ruizarguesonis]
MTKSVLIPAITLAAISSFASVARGQEPSQWNQSPADNQPSQTIVNSQTTPGLILSFQGGTPGDNASTVMRSLQSIDALPKRAYTVMQGESLCNIFDKLNYPPPCTAFTGIAEALNPGLNPMKLEQNQQIQVPDFRFIKYTGVRRFDGDELELQKAGNLQKSWTHLNPIQNHINRQTTVIRYDAFRVFVPASSDDDMERIKNSLESLSITNFSLDPQRSEPERGKVNSAIDAIKIACGAGNVPPQLNYLEMMRYDKSAMSSVTGSASAQVQVHLLDEPLNPFPTAPFTTSIRCRWAQFDRNLHHSTHLASIIASPTMANTGFIGLAPNAVLKPFDWVQNSQGDLVAFPGRDIKLSNLLNEEAEHGLPIDVFVAATQFAAKESEHKSLLSLTIEETSPLLVVSAGEPDAGAPPSAISKGSSLSPQNLGSLKNVLVVTACKKCNDADPALLGSANFSDDTAPPMVHVAAPGAEAIPGWLDDKSMGEAEGTSQSTAFVAGAIANMLGRYPEDYFAAFVAKRRVQVTSWPIADKLVAAGVVDPVLMQLDPTIDWIKDLNGRWRSVKVKSLGPKDVFYEVIADGSRKFVPSNAILRSVDLGSDKGFAVYYDMAMTDQKPKGAVGKLYGVKPVADLQILFCDGTIEPLFQTLDFVARLPKDGC